LGAAGRVAFGGGIHHLIAEPGIQASVIPKCGNRLSGKTTLKQDQQSKD
jgi:hypothetical protein